MVPYIAVSNPLSLIFSWVPSGLIEDRIHFDNNLHVFRHAHANQLQPGLLIHHPEAIRGKVSIQDLRSFRRRSQNGLDTIFGHPVVTHTPYRCAPAYLRRSTCRHRRCRT